MYLFEMPMLWLSWRAGLQFFVKEHLMTEDQAAATLLALPDVIVDKHGDTLYGIHLPERIVMQQ